MGERNETDLQQGKGVLAELGRKWQDKWIDTFRNRLTDRKIKASGQNREKVKRQEGSGVINQRDRNKGRQINRQV